MITLGQKVNGVVTFSQQILIASHVPSTVGESEGPWGTEVDEVLALMELRMGRQVLIS